MRCAAISILALFVFLQAVPALDAQAPPAKKEAWKPTEEEQAIIDATNKERVAQKLKPLRASEKLSKVARAHSENMAKQNKMNHELDGKKPDQRARAAGYAYAYIGENIAWNQRNPEELLEKWMESEVHKANILDKRFTEIGIGIGKNEKGEPYFTQVFGTPRR